MRHLKISALLSVIGVMTIAAVGNSATDKEAVVKLKGFDRKTETLSGHAGTEINLGYFKRLENTVHLPGVGGPNYPPNPCNAHISVYNKILQHVPEGAGRRNATLSVLGHMARSNCCMETVYDGTVDATQEPAGMYRARPVACAAD